MDIIDDFARKTLSRRGFLATAGTAAAAVAAGCNTALPAGTPPPTVAPTAGTAPTYSDTDILNFALNLEYLEAEFYLRAATGSGIPAADAGTGAGTVTGGSRVTVSSVPSATGGTLPLTTQQQNVINILAQDEYNHVKFLRAALGSAAVSRPNIDLVNSFNALATAATVGLATPLTSFNPFLNFQQFLLGGFVFEDVGVTAYHGGAGALSPKSPYLTPAAQILAVEAYHAATLRTLIVRSTLEAASSSVLTLGIPSTAATPITPTTSTTGAPLSTYGASNATLSTYGQFAAVQTGSSTATPPVPIYATGTLTYLQIANAIATFRAAVSGGSSVAAGDETLLSNGETLTGYTAATATAQAIPGFITVGSTTIVPADSNSIAFARTFDQVLHIVYGAPTGPSGYPFGLASGAFFPNGLNGNIKQTYS